MQVYATNVSRVRDLPSHDVRLWSGMYNLIPNTVGMVDRSGKIVMPADIAIYPPFKLPDISGPELTFTDCADLRAKELIAKARYLKTPIAIMYSGGIDSTTALCSIAKQLTPAELKNEVIVYMSQASINEYAKLYINFIRPNCTTRSSEHFSEIMNGQYLVIGGEHGDQMFGSDVIARVNRMYGGKKMHETFTWDFFVEFFMSVGISRESCKAWFRLLDDHAKNAPCEVKTIAQFLWWFNFIFKWQSVYFMGLLRVPRAQRAQITQHFCTTYFHQFFSSTEFQIWSMRNTSSKIGDTFSTYKHVAKALIYEFTKDAEYRDEKMKLGSLSQLFVQRDTAQALTTDFEFLDAVDAQQLYVPDNSFTAPL